MEVRMLDEMYEINLLKEIEELDRLDFPGLVKACRDIMGLKQYACSDYLGMEQPRYKKLELGRFKEPIETWEMARLQAFFQLPYGMLQRKEKEYFSCKTEGRKDLCESLWGARKETKGERPTV